MARSAFVPMEEREQGSSRGAAAKGQSQVVQAQQQQQQEEEQAVLLVHSQVRRIKKEEEEIRERLLKLRLLETRPTNAGGFCDPVAWRASRSLSPLRRAGNGIPVGDS